MRQKTKRREKVWNLMMDTSLGGPNGEWVEVTTGDRKDSGPAGGALQQKRVLSRDGALPGHLGVRV